MNVYRKKELGKIVWDFQRETERKSCKSSLRKYFSMMIIRWDWELAGDWENINFNFKILELKYIEKFHCNLIKQVQDSAHFLQKISKRKQKKTERLKGWENEKSENEFSSIDSLELRFYLQNYCFPSSLRVCLLRKSYNQYHLEIIIW